MRERAGHWWIQSSALTTVRGLGLSAFLFGAIAGCAMVSPMAFDRRATSIDTAARSVVLLTLEISRSDGSPYQPIPDIVRIWNVTVRSAADQHDFKIDRNADAISPDNGRRVYLVRMSLPPGTYKLMVVDGIARASQLSALFEVPLLADLNVKPQSIEYVGHIAAILRPRQDEEFRAGPLLPAIAQAASGMSESTWDITYEDRTTTDIALFRKAYPVLASASIATQPLPPFDRVAVQRWWDAQQAPKGRTAR